MSMSGHREAQAQAIIAIGCTALIVLSLLWLVIFK